MKLSSLVTPQMRVIDVSPPDLGLARELASAGAERYLALVPTDRLDTVRADDRAGRVEELTSASQILRNNADVLVLRGRYARSILALRDLSHVRYVALEASSAARGPALAGRLAGRLSGRAVPRGRFTGGGSEFHVVQLRGTRPNVPRRYLSSVLGVEGLAARAEQAGLRYTALRWFEDLPRIAPGEDLDLLVADDDLAALRSLLDEEPGTTPVDLYSVTGMPGADYQGAAYYPPILAESLLERSVVHASGCRVPAPEDHLHSLAYHAVYHKGGRAGLPSVLVTATDEPEHDYATSLHDLADSLGIALPMSLELLDEYLAGVGWQPPLDALRRLAPSNPWIGHRFLSTPPGESDPPEPAVFLIREATLPVVGLDEILAVLHSTGFEAIHVAELDEAGRRECAGMMRGGNWGRGPFPRSGGRPAVVVVAVHYGPSAVAATLRRQYPRLSNADTYYVKQRLRALVAERLPSTEHFNPVHSSDDEGEAWEYVDLALPADARRLRTELAERRDAYRTDDVRVLGLLNRGRRAKVELVETDGERAVRKTYAPGYLDHLRREIAARDVLRDVRAVPPIVDRGPTWFTCPYYDDALAGMESWRAGRLIPLSVVRQMVGVLRAVHAAGYDLVDARPENFLLDPAHGLMLVDFEFLHPYAGAGPAFEDSYSFVGTPAGFTGAGPVQPFSYEARWRRRTGLPLPALVGSGAPIAHVHRVAHRLLSTTVGRHSTGRRAARVARAGAQRWRRGLTARYAVWARARAASAFGS